MILLAGIAASLALSGCAAGSRSESTAEPATESTPVRCPSCAEAERTNGWCEPCARGYVAGRAVPSRIFHEALDAHGHELEGGGVLCLECAEVLESDGFCTRCQRGFVDGQLYFSELTWSLHRGAMRPREEVRCPGCRVAYGGAGECADACGARWVGSVEFRDPALHARAARQWRRLELALDRLATCEMCAAAGFFGQTCPKCGTPAIPENPAPENPGPENPSPE